MLLWMIRTPVERNVPLWDTTESYDDEDARPTVSSKARERSPQMCGLSQTSHFG